MAFVSACMESFAAYYFLKKPFKKFLLSLLAGNAVSYSITGTLLAMGIIQVNYF
jgi:hypothetical protein